MRHGRIKARKWADGFPSRDVKAEEAVAALEAIRARDGGKLTPEAVVDSARSKGSPRHRLFEWNDTEAARHELETWTRKYEEYRALAALVAVVKRLLGVTCPDGSGARAGQGAGRGTWHRTPRRPGSCSARCASPRRAGARSSFRSGSEVGSNSGLPRARNGP